MGVTGSIAAYKAADLIRRLREKGLRVSVIMTKEAEKFISPLTLGTLAGEKVHSEMFDDKSDSWEISHVQLAREADVFLVAPATANTIGKLAGALADDLLTCLALATTAPIVIAPAMNENMYRNPLVQANCRKLKDGGVHFIDPVEGSLACGIVGQGHIAEIDTIVQQVVTLIQKKQ